MQTRGSADRTWTETYRVGVSAALVGSITSTARSAMVTIDAHRFSASSHSFGKDVHRAEHPPVPVSSAAVVVDDVIDVPLLTDLDHKVTSIRPAPGHIGVSIGPISLAAELSEPDPHRAL